MTVTDDDGNTASQVITVTVNQVDDSATIGGATSGTGDEDGGAITGTLTATDTADGLTDGTIFTVTGAAGNGTATIDASSGLWSYNPDLNFNGTDSFTVTVTDDDGNTASQVIDLNVAAVNDEPSFTTLGNRTVAEDAGPQTVANFATFNPGGGSDEGGQTATYVVTNNNNSLFSTQPSIDSNGQLTYESAANANGSAVVTVYVQDNGGTANGGEDTSLTQTFTITVTPDNDVPVYDSDTDPAVDAVDENAANGTPVGVTAYFTDADGNPLTYSLSDDAGGRFQIDRVTGVVTVKDGRLLDYESATSHTITVLADDDNGGTMTQDFTIALNDLGELDGIMSIFNDLRKLGSDDEKEDPFNLFVGVGSGIFNQGGSLAIGSGATRSNTPFIAFNTDEGETLVGVSYRDEEGVLVMKTVRADSAGNVAVEVAGGSSVKIVVHHSAARGGKRELTLNGSHIPDGGEYQELSDDEIIGQFYSLDNETGTVEKLLGGLGIPSPGGAVE